MTALVVLSGGQDSTTCLAQAISERGLNKIHAITFDYGQRHAVEVEAARKIAILAGLKQRHEVVSIPDILKGSSPLVNKDKRVDIYPNAAALPGGLEKTFVPMRNTLFLTIAANRAVLIAQACGLREIDIIAGVSMEDYGGYPDCRQDFIWQLQYAFNRALDDPDLPKLALCTPLMHRTKRETVELSETFGVMARGLLALSHTCYNGQVPPCGTCHACLLRAKGYAEARVIDPLIERLQAQGQAPVIGVDPGAGDDRSAFIHPGIGLK